MEEEECKEGLEERYEAHGEAQVKWCGITEQSIGSFACVGVAARQEELEDVRRITVQMSP